MHTNIMANVPPLPMGTAKRRHLRHEGATADVTPFAGGLGDLVADVQSWLFDVP